MTLVQILTQPAVVGLILLGFIFIVLALWLKRKSVSDDDQIASVMYALTHDELSNPIQSAFAALANIENKVVSTEKESSTDIHTLRSSLNQLSNLTRNMRTLVSLEWPRSTRLMECVNIVAILQNLVVEMGDSADRAGVRLMYEGGDTKINVLGKREDLRRVFTNLVDNAVKFSSTNPQACVLVQVSMSKHSVVIEVSDNGPGISPTQLSAIDKCIQRSSAATAASRGSGLGLFLVKRIVEAHCGTLNFHSIEGKGTTVSVKLPLRN